MAVVVGLLHYLLSNVAVQFGEVFEGFGAELPLLTQMLLPGSLYYWIIPIVIALCFALHHAGLLSKVQVLFVTSAGTVLSIVTCITGLYLPIFQLGAVIQ